MGHFVDDDQSLLSYPCCRREIVKSFRLAERASLEIRTEAFNLFNHPNFDLPNIFFGTPAFGAIQSAESPRRIQFGAKILF